jgi:hypothetical protein
VNTAGTSSIHRYQVDSRRIGCIGYFSRECNGTLDLVGRLEVVNSSLTHVEDAGGIGMCNL